jgi:hypothetical protein
LVPPAVVLLFAVCAKRWFVLLQKLQTYRSDLGASWAIDRSVNRYFGLLSRFEKPTMKKSSRTLPTTVALHFAILCFAPAATLIFDDLPALSVPTEHYSHLGVHLRTSGADPSVRPGVSNGDLVWSVDGSAGPYFMGINNGYGITVLFDAPISSFSLDAFRPAVIGDTSFSLRAFYRGNHLGDQTVNLRSGGPWTNIVFNALLMDEIQWFIGGGGRYGIDNIQFTLAPGSGAPSIIASPYNSIAYIGSEVALNVRVSGQQPLSFQWYINGATLAGATNSTLWIPSVQTNHAGRYHATVSNVFGVAVSYTNTLNVTSGEPFFVNHPYSQSVYAGGYAYFYAYAEGYPNITYQWQFNGTSIAGATNYFLQLANVQTNQGGSYRAVASNASGSATSQVATLTVITVPPWFYSHPESQTVSEGSHVELRAYASGSPEPVYQWYFNGALVAGETKNVLKLYNVTTNAVGTYSAAAINIAGVTSSLPATLAVVRPNTLDNWEWRNPLPQGNELSGVAYANGQFVGVGRFGAIVTSPNGSNWTLRTSSTRNHLYSIAYGNGRFVAVGSGGEVLTSNDGITWTRQASATARNLYAVCYTNNQFVAVGRFGTILTSGNGLSWVSRNSGTTNHLRAVTYGMGRYVAAGSLGEIVTSTDANIWTRGSTGEVRNLRGVAFGNGTFVAVGNYGATLRSTNGVDWAVNPQAIFLDLRGVSFANGTFIAVGRAGYVYTSSDGLAWIYNYTPVYDGLYDIVKGVGNFLAVGERGALLIATNSGQWFDQRIEGGFNFTDVAYGAGRFAAVGNGPYGSTASNLWVSTDGRSGTFTSIASNVSFNSIIFAQGKFLSTGYECCSTNEYIWSSPDAVNWTAHDVAVPDAADIAYGNGKFIAVGGGYYYVNGYYTNAPNVALSVDGENWSSSYADAANSWLQHAAAGNGVFVVANYYSILYSTNGVQWTNTRTNVYDYYYGLANGNGIFVVVGLTYSPMLERFTLTSTDGATWVKHSLPINQYPNGVKWVNGLFVVLGAKGVLATSPDGVNWVRRNTTSESWLTSMAYGQRTYLAVGGDSAVLRSGELAFENPSPGFTNTSFELIFNGELGRVYRVQYSTDLQQWFDLGSITNTQPRMTFRDAGAEGRAYRFYRLATP